MPVPHGVSPPSDRITGLQAFFLLKHYCGNIGYELAAVQQHPTLAAALSEGRRTGTRRCGRTVGHRANRHVVTTGNNSEITVITVMREDWRHTPQN
jgi:hypothetical protein